MSVDILDKCICKYLWPEGYGYSVCGVPCPLHNTKAIKTNYQCMEDQDFAACMGWA